MSTMSSPRSPESDAMWATIQQIDTEAEACTACPLYQTRHEVVVAEIHGVPRILFIGQSPGEAEDKAGRPFVGASGQLLRGKILGLGLTDYGIINSINCHPERNQYKTEYATACRSFFVRKVNSLAPLVVVALGNDAYRQFITSGDTVVFSTVRAFLHFFHPAATMYNRALTERWDRHWADLPRVMEEAGIR